jgi:hypothetical protein
MRSGRFRLCGNRDVDAAPQRANEFAATTTRMPPSRNGGSAVAHGAVGVAGIDRQASRERFKSRQQPHAVRLRGHQSAGSSLPHNPLPHRAALAATHHPSPEVGGGVASRREERAKGLAGERAPRVATDPLPFTRSPVHPFTRSPVHPFTRSPVHPFTRSPVHPFTRSPVHPHFRSAIHASTLSRSIGSVTAPWRRTTSWNSRRSKRGPSSRSASSRRAKNSSAPVS